MSYVAAGAASGILMASVFMAVAPIILFVLAKDPAPLFRAFLDKISPLALMMGSVVLGFPVWGLVGAVVGLLYWASTEAVPGGGMGSPNLLYTVAVVVVALAVAVPLGLMLRRVAPGIAVLTLTFVGLFGWLLPFLAGR